MSVFIYLPTYLCNLFIMFDVIGLLTEETLFMRALLFPQDRKLKEFSIICYIVYSKKLSEYLELFVLSEEMK